MAELLVTGICFLILFLIRPSKGRSDYSDGFFDGFIVSELLDDLFDD
jgi:hypothetical protein